MKSLFQKVVEGTTGLQKKQEIDKLVEKSIRLEKKIEELEISYKI